MEEKWDNKFCLNECRRKKVIEKKNTSHQKVKNQSQVSSCQETDIVYRFAISYYSQIV
jgi:hypothetical protein